MKKPSVKLLVLAVALGGIGVSVFTARQSIAQFAGGGPVETTVTNTVQTEARITGQTVTLDIQGIVALDGASLEALNEPICPPLSAGHMGVDGTLRLVPPTAAAGRTKLVVVSHASAGGYLSCRSGPSVGFASPVCSTPLAGATAEGVFLFPSASLTLDVDETVLLRCLNCAAGGVPSGATVQVSYLEPSCL